MNEEMNKKIELLKSISLTMSEKKVIRNKISDFIDLTPATAQKLERPRAQRLYFGLFTTKIHTLRFMPALLIIAVLAGGGVSFAAEDSLPGDTLYSVKLNVNEEVATLFDFSAEAKAKRQADLARKRLEEAVVLVSEGKLTVEAKEQLALNFERHADKFEEQIEKIEGESGSHTSVELSSEFEASLNAHEEVLKNLEEGTEESVKIALRIGNKAKVVADTRESFEAKVKGQSEVSVKANAEGKMKAAENKLEEVRKSVALNTQVDAYAGTETRMQQDVSNENMMLPMSLLKTTDLTTSPAVSVKSKVEEKFIEAEQAFFEGKAKLEASLYGEAFALFQKAIRLSQEAKIVSNIEDKLKGTTDTRTQADIEVKIKNKNETKVGTTSSMLGPFIHFLGTNDEDDYIGIKENRPIGVPACKSDIESHYKIATKYISVNYPGNVVVKESGEISGRCANLNSASTVFKVIDSQRTLVGLVIVDGVSLKVYFNSLSKPFQENDNNSGPEIQSTTSGTLNTPTIPQKPGSTLNGNNTLQVGI